MHREKICLFFKFFKIVIKKLFEEMYADFDTLICQALFILLFAMNLLGFLFLFCISFSIVPISRLSRGKREDEYLMDLAPYGDRWSWFERKGRFSLVLASFVPGKMCEKGV